jgi:ketosteroid isomerase-like protein
LGCGADADTVRAELETVTRRWEASLVAGDPVGAVTSVFTEDAVRLPAGEPPVRGWSAISAALDGSAALVSADFRIEDVDAAGDLAYASGTYSVRAPDGRELSGKFLEVWKRTSRGWRIHRVMWD